MDISTKTKAPRYSPAQWEVQKPNIERLYILEDKPLKEVLHILAQAFDFQASEKQLKSRLTKWGFDVKNMKGDTMVQLARIKAKRRLEKKESSFRVAKKPVDDQKIERYLRRHDITENDLLAMASPERAPSPSYSVFTPRESVRSPTPDNFFYLKPDQSPIRGLNFQSLSIIEEQPEQVVEQMVIEDSSSEPSPVLPTESLSSQSPSTQDEQPSDYSMFEDTMDEDSTNVSGTVDTDYLANILDDFDPIWDTDLRPAEMVMREELWMNQLWSIHIEAEDTEDEEEQYGPPPSPAELASSDIEERARRIATFHGSVFVRYLEKAMERAKTRTHFAPDVQLGARCIYYCLRCNEYYAADRLGCHCSMPPKPSDLKLIDLEPSSGWPCAICGVHVTHLSHTNPDQEALCPDCLYIRSSILWDSYPDANSVGPLTANLGSTS